jgi:hypothetical protein
MIALALVVLLEPPPTSPRDWMVERNGALELALVHCEADRLDGGILTVDPRRRVVIWEGISGDLGCRLKIEASFDDVRSVAVGEPGFGLEFRKGKGHRMLLIPRPHAEWLLHERKVVYRDAARVTEGIIDTPPDQQALPLSGASGSNAPIPHSLGHSVDGHRRHSRRGRRNPGCAWAHPSRHASVTRTV